MLKSRMKDPDVTTHETDVSGGSLYMTSPHFTVALGSVTTSRALWISFLKGNLEVQMWLGYLSFV